MSDQITFESTTRHAEIDGLRVRYHEAGQGPLLLLMHGGAPGAYGWGNFGQNLADFAPHFRTVIVDLPGYGQSDEPDFAGAGRYTTYARIFAGLIRQLGETKAHVLGMATGGAAAIKMAVDDPEVVDRLVLVSSAGGLPIFSTMPSEGQKHIRAYYKGEGPSREKMRAYLEMMLADTSLITDELIEERYQASLGKTGEGTSGPNEVVWPELSMIKAKTLIMWGTENRIQGFDNALFMLKQIPDAELHLFGKTGLWLPFERAEAFVREVTGFLTT
ncbi:MAG: alpha/beta hydrolase [Propionibacteriaceae bacterium]|nr:alpha/beta hydrolase [Propionibacteriaceae bacterium]